jgi:hypothetical protein
MMRKKMDGKKEIWIHWVAKKPYWELKEDEIDKAYHKNEMVYVGNQWYMWSGSWRGNHPCCWCGHEYDEDDMYFTTDEFEEWKRKISKNKKGGGYEGNKREMGRNTENDG